MLIALINFARIFPNVIGGYSILCASIKYENLKSVSSKTPVLTPESASFIGRESKLADSREFDSRALFWP